MLFSSAGSSAQDSATTPQKFWTEFRAAVMERDSAKLAQMTTFPLEVRGVDDGQPTVYYNKQQFAQAFERVLSQPIFTRKGGEVVTSTMRDAVRATEAINQAHMMTKDSFRVEQLVFERKDKQWKLSRVYLEE